MGLCPHAQRRPGLARRPAPPALTPAIEQCIASERPDAAIRTQTAEATNSGVTATPSLRLHDRETGKPILLQGPIEGDALLSAMDMLAAAAIPPPHPHRKCLPTSSATCPGSPGLRGYGAVRCADHNPFAFASWPRTITAAAVVDGCTLFVPQEGLPSLGERLRSHRLEVRHVFAVNDSCLESLSAIAAQHEDWIIQQTIVLLERRVFKAGPCLSQPAVYGLPASETGR